MRADEIEVPFQWTCPKCEHHQTDTVNPLYGPFLTLICGKCQEVFDQDTLSETDWTAFDAAVVEAERLGEKERIL